MQKTITILGINGRIGQEAARAFVAAGWRVFGFGRTDRVKIAGVTFISGDAENSEDIARAAAPADVVLDAVNLPYDKWDKGRYEKSLAARLDGLAGSGKTLLYPGNIYNYAEKTHLLTPETPENPARDKGEIRVRLERMMKHASNEDNLQVVILRAPDFFGPGASGTTLDLIMLKNIARDVHRFAETVDVSRSLFGRVSGRITGVHLSWKRSRNVLAYPGDPAIGHSWAYLPDLARAFVRLAEECQTLGRFERFHFAGHFRTGHHFAAATGRALHATPELKQVNWLPYRLIGLVVPLVREVLKMNYLWDNPHRLKDDRLDALLGPDFLTPFDEAVAATVTSYLPAQKADHGLAAKTA